MSVPVSNTEQPTSSANVRRVVVDGQRQPRYLARAAELSTKPTCVIPTPIAQVTSTRSSRQPMTRPGHCCPSTVTRTSVCSGGHAGDGFRPAAHRGSAASRRAAQARPARHHQCLWAAVRPADSNRRFGSTRSASKAPYRQIRPLHPLLLAREARGGSRRKIGGRLGTDSGRGGSGGRARAAVAGAAARRLVM